MASNIVKILSNATIAKLHEPTNQLRNEVGDILSYKVEGSEFSGPATWDGMSSYFIRRNNSFPAGFCRLVKIKLEKRGYIVKIIRKKAPEPLGDLRPKIDNFPEDPNYEYQYDAAEKLVSLERMIAQIATGGGKSRIFKICQARINRPTLFITTRKSLMYQMAESYEETTGKKAGLIGDGHWSPNPEGSTFAIVNTLANRVKTISKKDLVDRAVQEWHDNIEDLLSQKLESVGLPNNTSMFRTIPKAVKDKIEALRKAIQDANPLDDERTEIYIKRALKKYETDRPQAIDFLNKIEFLCLEEAHEVSASDYENISNLCKNAYYRLALTATPFMKDDEKANMTLMGVSGPIGIKVTEKDLIDKGILATPYFRYAKVPPPPNLSRASSWQKAYKIGIVENKKRNEEIINECLRQAKYKLPTMILIQRKNHGDLLERLLKLNGLKVKFIHGKHEQVERSSALEDLEKGRIDVLIGSTILDVGVDVPSVGLIILAGGGKAEVALRQRIGRGLRAKKTGSNVAFILDFDDGRNKHLILHARERQRVVKSTPGFSENIVKNFDYSLLGNL